MSHSLKALHNLLYVAFVPRFSFHSLNIAIFCERTERGGTAPSISRSSAAVRPRNGDISLQSIIQTEILAKCFSEHVLVMLLSAASSGPAIVAKRARRKNKKSWVGLVRHALWLMGMAKFTRPDAGSKIFT